jgi:hypothetical protein
MMNKFLKLLPVLALGAASSYAQTLVQWNSWDSDTTQHIEMADVLVSGLTGGDLLTGPDGTAGAPIGVSLNASGPTTDSATFSFTNNSGAVASLSSLAFTFQKQAYPGGSDNTSLSWGSVDVIALSGLTGVTDGDTIATRPVQGGQYYNITQTTDLTGLTIADGVTANFEISVVWDGVTALTDTNFGKQVRVNDITFSGTVVPEPSTYAILFGVVALGLAVYRRRTRA